MRPCDHVFSRKGYGSNYLKIGPQFVDAASKPQVEALSVVATQIYQTMPQCMALVLCPCCSLRNLDLKRADRLQLPQSFLAKLQAKDSTGGVLGK
eukprot:s2041_g8.t1